MTFSSSLPICAVSPAETLRSLMMPSKRRAHFGALELLARGDHTRARGLAIALRGVTAALRIFELLRRHDAGLTQRRHALELALGLLIRLNRRRAAMRRPTVSVIANGGLVEAHEQVALLHRVAVLLEHGQHDGRHLGPQVRAALGLNRARDRRPAERALFFTVSRSSCESSSGEAAATGASFASALPGAVALPGALVASGKSQTEK